MRVGLMIWLILICCVGWAGAQSLREWQYQGVDSQVSVYPNPASDDFIYVRLTKPLEAYGMRINLYNIIGNEVPAEFEVMNQYELRIRIKELPAGYYLLGLREERSRFKGTYKFLKR